MNSIATLQNNTESVMENDGNFEQVCLFTLSDEVFLSKTLSDLEEKSHEKNIVDESESSDKVDDNKNPSRELYNYKYCESDNLFSGGNKTKFRNNIEAIRLVKHLENKLANPDEQKTLANYLGWGGLADAFSKKDIWANENKELKLLLSESEYKTAMGSTITAFYTEPKLAQFMYRALQRLGFNDGNDRLILEPSIGTGIFYSVLPDYLDNANLYGVELDEVSGKIAKQLYQNADIQIKGFESTGFQDNTFDIVIGNIPFSNIKVNDNRYNKHNFIIHDYFIAKSIDLLKPGGVAALITTKNTLDKYSEDARRHFNKKAELIAALRLPNNTFTKISGTSVTADILFFKKRNKPLNSQDSCIDSDPQWLYTGWDNLAKCSINRYFINNPDMIMGKVVQDWSMYGNQNGTACVLEDDTDLYELLEKSLEGFKPCF